MNQKNTENPVLRLLIATPEIVNFLRSNEQHLFRHKDELDLDFDVLDADGMAVIRDRIASIFPGQALVPLFHPVLVQALKAQLQAQAKECGTLDLPLDLRPILFNNRTRNCICEYCGKLIPIAVKKTWERIAGRSKNYHMDCAEKLGKLQDMYLEDGAADLLVLVPVDDHVFVQLATILLRLASDYLSARDLFEAHKDAFSRSFPRILSFNPITGAISWEKVRSQVEEILLEAFQQRYEEMAINISEHFRDSKLANEALMIGVMLCDQSKPEQIPSGGLEFERECEKLLRDAEFTVEPTPMSGDFGVDLLARKNGLTYAIQCKCYGIPVGISAVQEAAAGRLHYMADYAVVVVANSGFTTQARRLAESNSVLLIGPAQLAGLQDLARGLIR
jgi:hypothetical protein